MPTKEIVGALSSLLIIASMIFKTSTYKGTMLMRSINAIGSIMFILYGFVCTDAYATGATNACGLLLNIFWLIKEYKDHKQMC